MFDDQIPGDDELRSGVPQAIHIRTDSRLSAERVFSQTQKTVPFLSLEMPPPPTMIPTPPAESSPLPPIQAIGGSAAVMACAAVLAIVGHSYSRPPGSNEIAACGPVIMMGIRTAARVESAKTQRLSLIAPDFARRIFEAVQFWTSGSSAKVSRGRFFRRWRVGESPTGKAQHHVQSLGRRFQQ